MRWRFLIASVCVWALDGQALAPVPLQRQGFPLAESQVAKMRAAAENGDPAALRSHGWRLLDLIFADTDRRPGNYRPVWYTWCTAAEVFEREDLPCVAGEPRSEEPMFSRRVSRLPSRSRVKSLDLSLIVSDVYISPEMAAYLNKPRPGVKNLRLPGESLPVLLKAKREALPDDFRRDEVIVKVAWQHVPCPTEKASYLKVWNGRKQLGAKGDLLKDATNFTSIELSFRKIPPDSSAQPRCRPKFPGSANAKSLNDYFWFQIRNEDDLPKVLGKPTTEIPAGKEFVKVGDYFIASGIHIITRESPEWVWATYWLTDKKDEMDLSTLGRSSLKGSGTGKNKARQFAMNISMNSEQAIANPFLEGQLRQGIHSNCLHCHRQASLFAAGGKTTCLIPLPAKGPMPPVAKTSLATSFLWVLANQGAGGCSVVDH